MHTKRRHRIWGTFLAIKPWYFLGIAAVLAVVTVFALRANNQHMVELRTAVYTADKNGEDVQAPLHKLQAYVSTHMNTNLSSGTNAVYPPIQLKYTYDRLVQAQTEATAQRNSQIYNEAQKYCEQQDSTDFSGRNRVPCIEAYVKSHSVSTAASIPDALYKFSFTSPTWSPDLAGWSLVATLLATTLFLLSTIDKIIRKYLQ